MIRRPILASVVALAVAGCGGPASSTMVRLRAQAGRVCTRAHVQDAGIAPPRVPAQTVAFLRRGIAVLAPELANLRTLHAPREQADTYSSGLAALAHEITILTATVHDLDHGADPLRTIKTLQHRLAPVEAAGDAAWRTLEIPACVNR
jgi:hypothetical protein